MAEPTEVEIPQQYFLEWVEGPGLALQQAVECPNVFSYSDEPIPADHADWTLAGLPIEQHTGIRQRQLSVQGVSGLAPRAYSRINVSNGSTVTTANLGGRERFEDFKNFIDSYYEAAAKTKSAFVQNTAKMPRIIFRALKEGTSYIVRDIKLTPTEQVGQTRMSYGYSLTMVGIGPPQRKVDYYNSVINNVSLALETANQAIAKSLSDIKDKAKASDFDDGLLDIPGQSHPASLMGVLNKLPGYLASFKAPVLFVMGKIDAFVGAVTAAARAGIGLPTGAVSDLYAFVSKGCSDVYSIWDSLAGLERAFSREYLMAILTPLKNLKRSLENYLGSAGAKAPRTVPTNMSQPTQGGSTSSPPIVHEQVQQGEDIFSFSARVFNDPLQWSVVMALNAMSSASTLGDGSPFSQGTILAIPAGQGDGYQTRPDAPEANIFGTDIAWSIPQWDWLPEGDPPRDIRAITGPANLQARLIHRFTKEQGSDLTAPRLGMPAVTGQAQTSALAALIAGQAITQATADGAVARLRYARFQQTANVYVATLSVVPIGGKTITFDNVPIGLSVGGA